jgi:putative ABC transport system permease protein
MGVAHVPGLAPQVLTVQGSQSMAAMSGNPAVSEPVRLVTRTGEFQHVRVLSGPSGSGVWITDTTAGALHVKLGDAIVLSQERPVTVRVAAVYEDLSKEPLRTFWCSQASLIFLTNVFSNGTPPPLVLVDLATYLRLGARTREAGDFVTWEYPLGPGPLTLTEAQRTAAGLRRAQATVDSATGFGAVFDRATTNTSLPAITDQVLATVAALKGPADTVALAGTAVALLVVAAAGMYWIDRRRIETDLLVSKGVGPLGLAAKVVLEGLVPAAAAALAGWALAVLLVKTIGPASLLDAGVMGHALRQVALISAAAICLMGIVAGMAARRDPEAASGRARKALARAPWELALLALAAASLYEIQTRGTAPVSTPGAPPKVDALLLLFPILFLAGAAGLAGRGVRLLLPRLRSLGTRASAAIYLATRRLAGASRIALGLLTAVALAVGILVYAGSFAASVRATSDAKAQVFTGSDVSVTLGKDLPVPAALSAVATRVTMVTSGVNVAGLPPGEGVVDLLAVDPTTFARAAYWDPSFAGRSLSSLMTALSGGASNSMPMIVVGITVPTQGSISFSGASTAEYRLVATVRAFPGEQESTPLIVIDRAALPPVQLPRIEQLWARGSASAVDRALRASGQIVISQVTAVEVEANSDFSAITWSFRFLQALGLLTGLIALGGTLLYLEARQRARDVAYALSRRMGLSARAHLRSMVAELGGMLLAGFAVGSILAAVASHIVYQKLDPMPGLPPGPLFRFPLGLIVVTALVVVAVSMIGAWLVQRSAERADVGQVMRLAV